ncbi:flagellar hook-length control protein FliK [Desulfarculus baarsii]
MNALEMSIDKTAGSAALWALGAKGQAGGGFDALLAALSTKIQAKEQAALQTDTTTTTKAALAQTSSTTDETALVSPPNTPVAKLERSLRDSGQSLDEMTLPAQSREQVKEVLVASGYTEDQADEIVRRATDDNGDINVGALFQVLPQYTPTVGTNLFIAENDKPLLIQALQDLGVPAEDIRQFFEAASRDGEMINLTGIQDLLAKADPTVKSVDLSVMRDLMGKLGLDEQEITTLLARAGDGKGGVSPQGMLEILQAAAEKGNTKTGQLILQLTSQAKVKNSDGQDLAQQLRQQVNQRLESPPSQAQANQTTADSGQAATEQTGQATQANPNAQTPGQQANAAQTNPNAQAAQATQADGEQAQGQTQGQTGVGSTAAEAAALAKATGNSFSGGGSNGGQAGQQQAGAQAQQAAAQARAAVAGASDKAETGARATENALAGAASAAGKGSAVQIGDAVSKALPAYVVRQVAQQMASMVRANQTQLTLNLKPEHLGALEMEISVKDGAVTATLTAETPSAKLALESGLGELQDRLAQQGIRVEKIEVALGSNASQDRQTAGADASGGQNGSNRHGDGQGQGDGASGSAEEEPDQIMPATFIGVSRINLFA